MEEYKSAAWWGYMEEPMRDLMRQCFEQIKEEETNFHNYSDYSFVVFPAAKAYEGFLKKLFLDMGLISRMQYVGEHFRIGRALSPTLPKRYRSGWVFGKLVASCDGGELPMQMWGVWKKARNIVFHYFPGKEGKLTLVDAKARVSDIVKIMGESLDGCQV